MTGTGHNLQIHRFRLTIHGAVQGVGFRPFIYRLAQFHHLPGWVVNTAQGVIIEVEGPQSALTQFRNRIETEKPVLAAIHAVETNILEPTGMTNFTIRQSPTTGQPSTIILPDIATCSNCIREILDHKNRRYRYPFTNCTNCGPRFSIINALPYDRPNTSMHTFTMCEECRTEYKDPHDRRFHAQPIACPNCGPQLALWNNQGQTIATKHDALQQAADALANGNILALKGLGGFQLLADARNQSAVTELRKRKHREDKPFAIMVPSIDHARQLCDIDDTEATLLDAPAAPIVLLHRRDNDTIANAVAPDNPYLGIMRPCTPLHYLLISEIDFPIVATSGNRSDEPICIDEFEALDRLNDIADFLLVHNRPIVRHVDDSVVRVLAGRPSIIRRARGYAPLPINDINATEPILATGSHQKNTVALAINGHIYMSQHIGDLVTPQAIDAFDAATRDLPKLYDAKPSTIACDLHPDYASTRRAANLGRSIIPIQHHHAHIVSCMLDNEIDGDVLGIAWDGTGLGTDNTIWGGEFLLCNRMTFCRISHLKPFLLPGGESAAREPRRSAIGLLYQIYGDAIFDYRAQADVHKSDGTARKHHCSFDPTNLAPVQAFNLNERRILQSMLTNEINCTTTTSMGRIFDAVAAILNIRQKVTTEGQAAMNLEFLAQQSTTNSAYEFTIETQPPSASGASLVRGPHLTRSPPGIPSDSSPPSDEPNTQESIRIINFTPMIHAIISDLNHSKSPADIARTFHNTIVEFIIRVAEMTNKLRVVLSGGCFQNELLLQRAVQRLQQTGHQPYWHQRIPPNDGGIALGQAVIAQNIQNAKRSDDTIDRRPTTTAYATKETPKCA
jgi:hydrogenase maturation protein HypF